MPDDRIDLHYTWPLVLLTDLCASSQKNLTGLVKSTLEDDLESHSDKYFGASTQAENATHKVNVNVHVWSPNRRLLGSIAQKGPHRDSQSNLYALAILAYRSGRPRIIVADETTKRQLSGNILGDRDISLIGEEEHISIILLSTQRDPDSGEFSVFAKRAVCSPQETMFNLDDIDYIWSDPDPQKRPFKSVHKSWGPLWAHGLGWRGTMLHDPDEEPFKHGTADILAREYCAKAVITAFSHYLPAELAIQISNTNSVPIKMPVWNRRPSNTHLVIFVLYPATSQDLGEMYQRLEEAIPKKFFHTRRRFPRTISSTSFVPETEEWCTEPHMTLELVPWDRHRMKTRRDLVNFWNEYRVWDAELGRKEHGIMPLLFLRRPLSALDEAQFGVFTCRPLQPNTLFVREMKFLNICTEMEDCGVVHTSGEGNYRFTSYELEPRNKGAKEILCQPDEPFFINPPLWLPIIMTSWNRTVVFLTNQLSNAAKQRLKQLIVPPIEVQSDGSDYDARFEPCFPEYSIVPWRADAMIDGKVEDIWELVQALYVYPKAYERVTISFVCVDRQFELDQSIILVQVEEWADSEHDLLQDLPFPRLRGFKYARASAELAYFDNTNNVNVRAVNHGWSKFRRPRWPAPGILPDDPVEDIDYVDGSAYP
ncbi:hypothetical protein PITC_085380 [Penicillium italicum]|uniref:Uncharacterized protein n=1 Tax=Penicillium italicum TaxID=40296 RepID=A0A0A2L9V6_PENIT|nr:hypothetical protein PITC_085380 [Penicillium italicum]